MQGLSECLISLLDCVEIDIGHMQSYSVSSITSHQLPWPSLRIEFDICSVILEVRLFIVLLYGRFRCEVYARTNNHTSEKYTIKIV